MKKEIIKLLQDLKVDIINDELVNLKGFGVLMLNQSYKNKDEQFIIYGETLDENDEYIFDKIEIGDIVTPEKTIYKDFNVLKGKLLREQTIIKKDNALKIGIVIECYAEKVKLKENLGDAYIMSYCWFSIYKKVKNNEKHQY